MHITIKNFQLLIPEYNGTYVYELRKENQTQIIALFNFGSMASRNSSFNGLIPSSSLKLENQIPSKCEKQKRLRRMWFTNMNTTHNDTIKKISFYEYHNVSDASWSPSSVPCLLISMWTVDIAANTSMHCSITVTIFNSGHGCWSLTHIVRKSSFRVDWLCHTRLSAKVKGCRNRNFELGGRWCACRGGLINNLLVPRQTH